MPYNTITTDLDGTLLNGERRLGDYTREVLRWLHASGRTLILASGRHCIDLEGICKRLGLSLYLIGSNGAQVVAPDGRTLHAQPLATEHLQQLIALGREKGVHVNLHFGDRWLVEKANPELLASHQDSGFAYRIEPLGSGAYYKGVIKLFYVGEPTALRELEAAIQSSAMAKALQVVFAEGRALEIMAKGTCKGAALKRVLADLGHRAAQLVAFGDGMNDYEMLKLAGHGLLMKNAMPGLKRALPHLEVIGHHRDEAVATYLAESFGYPYQAHQAA